MALQDDTWLLVEWQNGTWVMNLCEKLLLPFQQNCLKWCFLCWQGTTTYYKHLEKTIVREPVDRTKLRMTVGDFVHTEVGRSFQDYHTEHLTKLEWQHASPDPKLTLPGSEGKHYHYILPAVYKLIQHLQDQNRDFNLVIRTYGLDCENVLSSLSHCIEGKHHPSFPDLTDMPIRLHSGHIVREDGNKIKLQVTALNVILALSNVLGKCCVPVKVHYRPRGILQVSLYVKVFT